MSAEGKSWQKGGVAVNICNFGGAVGEISKKVWHFGLKDVTVAESDWGKNDW